MDPGTGLLLIRASSGDVRVAFGGGDEDFSSRDLSFELLLASLSLAHVFDSRGTEWDLCVNAMCASSKNSRC